MFEDRAAQGVRLGQQHQETPLSVHGQDVRRPHGALQELHDQGEPVAELGVADPAPQRIQGSDVDLQEREAATEAVRLLDLGADHVLEVLEDVGAGARVGEGALLHGAEALRIREGGFSELHELLTTGLVDRVELVVAELVGEAHEADQSPFAAHRDVQGRALLAPPLAPRPEDGVSRAVDQLLGDIGDGDGVGLLVHPDQPANGNQVQPVGLLFAHDPDDAALGPGLDAEPLDDAGRQRIDGEARKEGRGALEEAALAHVLDVLGQQTSVLGLQAAVVEDLLQGVGQGRAIEGLDEVLRGAQLHRVDGGLHIDDARHHHDLLLGVPLLYAVDEIVAIHAGHHEVGEDDVEVALFEDAQGLFAARGRDDVVALFREQPFEQLAEIPLVVNR